MSITKTELKKKLAQAGGSKNFDAVLKVTLNIRVSSTASSEKMLRVSLRI